MKKFITKNKPEYLTVIRNTRNFGYGGSQKIAFRYAISNGYRYMIEYDSDLQYPYDKIPHLYGNISEGKCCIVFGSRITKRENYSQMPPWKLFGNKLFSRINEWAFGFHVSEIHTGLRAYNLELMKSFRIDSCHDDYRWTIDSVIEIRKINSSFAEVPVRAIYHKNAKSPGVVSLFKTMSYMLYRAIMYKLTSS